MWGAECVGAWQVPACPGLPVQYLCPKVITGCGERLWEVQGEGVCIFSAPLNSREV